MKPGRGDDWRKEIDSHFEMRAEWNARQGASPEEAREEARKQLGSPLRAWEEVRAVHVSAWIDGVMSFLVAQRTREIGVRMAVGATPRDIAILIQKHALAWTGAGLGVGLVSSIFLTRLVRGLLFEVSPLDPVSLAIAAGVVVMAASVAGRGPSHRAARVDPAVALRRE